MGKIKRVLIICAAAAVLVFAGIQLYNLFHFRMYKGYTQYLKNYEAASAGEAGVLTFLSGTDVPGMKLVSENDFLALYTNTETAEVAVFDKRNGEIAYSNPQDADDDPVATPLNKSYLKSQLIVEYYSSNRNMAIFNTWDHAVSLAQFEYAAIPGGIRYTYTLGDFSRPTGIVPLSLSVPRMEELMSKMVEKNAARFKGYYRAPDSPEGLYTLNEGSKQSASIRNITRFLEEVGYTEDDYYADMASVGSDEAKPVSFVISVDYVLNADNLEVTVPTNLIQEDGGGQVARIQLLRYMGAGGADEAGYMLVPNGSGSIIRFNNGKTNVPNYSQFVYGIDPLLAEYIVTEQSQQARFPVYGIAKANGGVFASIENGDTLSSINSYISGMVNSYNFTYPTFVLRSGDRLTMFGATDISADLPIVERDYYDTNLSVKYYMLTAEEANYSGMANLYRNKLISEGVLTQKSATSHIPFFMDLLGGAQGMGFVLGAQYSQTIPMTTFEEAAFITEDMRQNGVLNQYVNLQGWFNRGYYHDAPDKINILSKLGGASALEELSANIQGNGGRLYGETAFQKLPFGAKRFNFQLESSRYYGAGYIAAFGQVNPVSNMQTNSMGYREIMYDLVSPKFLDRYVDKYTKEITDTALTGITLRDLGDTLHSDKKRTEVINREQAKNIVLAQFDKLAQTGKNIMVSGGNKYSLKYADSLINVPLTHNTYFITDEEVPFFQMVVHGYLDYAGEAINLTTTSSNADITMRLIASGASPHYTFTFESSSLLKKTGLNNYRSTTYENWKTDAAEIYEVVNTALADVSGQPIVKHEINEPGVTTTYYENGVSITVNKNDYSAVVNGLEVFAKSYIKGVWK
ncbi:MAG: DUF5696 domain-containing protein [Clostridiales bacterium]|jgi:hypothetical protein|nr:DUF5696 domain-containing protein [Clostridiales bacterium]